MKTNDIITWLRDQALRAPEDVLKRGMIRAADKLEELDAELKSEIYRHDRLQDFKVAEAEALARYCKAEKEGRLIVLDETVALAMAAGARSIENNRRLDGTIYCWDPFKESKEISYYAAAEMLRNLSRPLLEGGHP